MDDARRFERALADAGLPVTVCTHFEHDPPTLLNHFRVLEEARAPD